MYGIQVQGQALEVNVVRCNKLKDSEFVSRQDPYVCLEYGSNRYRTRTCTDGDRNPVFHEKFMFTLFEGLRDLTVSVYNSNSLRGDDFIGRGSVSLQRVTSQGYDDSAWPIFRDNGRSAGEVCLMLRCPNINASTCYAPPAASPYVQPAVYYPPSVPPAPYQPPAPAAYNPYLQQPTAPGFYGQGYPPTPPPYYGQGYPPAQPPYYGRST